MHILDTVPKAGDIISNAKGVEYKVTLIVWTHDYSSVSCIMAIKADGTSSRSIRFGVAR